MTEAVIVATARSPIGRANKGSLTTMRPDDMSAQIVRALMAKVPGLSPSDVEDLIDRGEVAREDAESHPLANVINRAVGGGPELFVDAQLFQIKPANLQHIQ